MAKSHVGVWRMVRAMMKRLATGRELSPFPGTPADAFESVYARRPDARGARQSPLAQQGHLALVEVVGRDSASILDGGCGNGATRYLIGCAPLNVPRAESTRVERLNVIVLVIMSAVFVATRRQIPAAGGLACGFAGLAMATAVLPRVADRWAVAGMRLILQGVALLSIYESLGLVIHAMGSPSRDPWVLACERLVTRGHLPPLAVVMLPPWASDFLSLAYVTYFVLPVSLIVALIWRRRWMDAHAAMLTLLVAFYLHYAIYVLVPVVGPVRTTALPADIQMHIVAQGSRLTHDLRTLIGILERTPQDAFPSAHTSITLLIAAVARKHRLPVRWAFYVVAVPIIASTVLLGYHYVVDVLAALPVAWAAWRLSQPSVGQQARWAFAEGTSSRGGSDSSSVSPAA